ncbi:hypothetical protein [Mesobacillus foraminis]|nr:hypothetical protein [Mesobacillus foraminis]
MAKFTAEEKIIISQLYLERKHSYLELQHFYKVSYQMIQGWGPFI